MSTCNKRSPNSQFSLTLLFYYLHTSWLLMPISIVTIYGWLCEVFSYLQTVSKQNQEQGVLVFLFQRGGREWLSLKDAGWMTARVSTLPSEVT